MADISQTKKSGVSYVYAIIGVAMVLFLLGTLGWIVIYGGELSKSLRESVQVVVIFNDNTRDENGLALKKIIEEQNFTKSCEFITKEQALKDWQKMTGENAENLVEFNPLYSSINVRLKSEYINADSLNKINAFIMQSNIVREVDVQRNLVEAMNNNFRKIGAIVLAIAIVLIIIVSLLIDNTIRLAMYSQRFLIKTMQFVGATRFFIAKPFAVRSIINGLISALVAILAIWFMKGIVENYLPELKGIQNNKRLILLCLAILVMGVGISLASTYRSVIKYLKTSLDDLY